MTKDEFSASHPPLILMPFSSNLSDPIRDMEVINLHVCDTRRVSSPSLKILGISSPADSRGKMSNVVCKGWITGISSRAFFTTSVFGSDLKKYLITRLRECSVGCSGALNRSAHSCRWPESISPRSRLLPTTPAPEDSRHVKMSRTEESSGWSAFSMSDISNWIRSETASASPFSKVIMIGSFSPV